LYQSAISCSKYTNTPLPFFLVESQIEDFMVVIDEISKAIDRENKAMKKG